MEHRFDINKPMQVGGQAVLEGVMMRAPGMVATAVRRSNGEIVVKKEPHQSLGERRPIFKSPLLRGAVGLIEMMIIGIRTLNFSAEIAMEDASTKGQGNGNDRTTATGKKKESFKLALTVTVSLLIGIAIFFLTPLAVTTSLFDVEQDPFWFNLIAGAIRVSLLLVYLGAISMLKDIDRLFQYHGAEHKAVFAFELGKPLDVANAARQSRFHPRCGTSFLLIVMIVSILLFSLLDAALISLFGSIDLLTRLLTHLPLIPLVGGISYEIIRTSAKRSEPPLGKIIVAPGLWLQRITTREPDERQLEVALVALCHALGKANELESAPIAVLSSHPISVN